MRTESLEERVAVEEFALAKGGDIETLIALGKRLDDRVVGGESVRELLARTLLKIRDKRGRARALQLNAAQRKFEAECGQKNIILKARQLGMTTWVAARFLIHTITRPGTLSVQVAHDQDSAEQIFKIVRRMVENLPPSVQQAVRVSRANVRQIVFAGLESEFRVETAADANAGRGLTIQNLHGSEVSRWPGNVEETLASLRAAVVPGGEVTLESTANGAWGAFYREWQNAEEKGYVRHFFPWWMEPAYRIETLMDGNIEVESGRGASASVAGGCLEGGIALNDEERDLCAQWGLDAAQIAFRRQVKREFGKRANEEFAEDAESCFLATGECVFDVEKLDSRMAEIGDPVERRDAGRLEIYWPSQPGHEYVLGVDAAGGGSEGDLSCVQVIERETAMQCAEWYGRCSLAELARRSAELAKEYNRAEVAVERNNHGHGVLAHLQVSEKYERLYCDGSNPGWVTTLLTRPRMIERVMTLVERNAEMIWSRRLLRECRTFVRHEDGRMAAARGEHDDAVMAVAVALSCR
jgi:hypothetical protein